MFDIIQISRIVIRIGTFKRAVPKDSETWEPVIVTAWNTWVIAGFYSPVDLYANLQSVCYFRIYIALDIVSFKGKFPT